MVKELQNHPVLRKYTNVYSLKINHQLATFKDL